jgi:glycosyltransferase involved in cell wall biosynthesis
VCGLLGRGHKVTLVSFGKTPTAAQSAWVAHERLTYYPTVFPLEWMQDSHAGITESARYLERIIRRSQPDVLHFSQYCYGALQCDAPKLVVAHSDVVSWWNAVHETAPPQSPWIERYTALVSRGLRCADAVVTPSGWMLNTLGQYYELPSRCSVIYNGRSTALFSSSARKTECVLSVGRLWDEGKQVKLLLARNQSVPVRIAGCVDHPDKTLPSDNQLRQDDRFRGEQDEAQMRALYAEASTYAATSRYEPFGLAPVEAALSRCALIANDIPVFRELWGDAAFYFKRNDADSLAQAIWILAHNASLREMFAEHAYEWARSRFNTPRMITEYEDLYRSLIGRGASA